MPALQGKNISLKLLESYMCVKKVKNKLNLILYAEFTEKTLDWMGGSFGRTVVSYTVFYPPPSKLQLLKVVCLTMAVSFSAFVNAAP